MTKVPSRRGKGAPPHQPVRARAVWLGWQSEAPRRSRRPHLASGAQSVAFRSARAYVRDQGRRLRGSPGRQHDGRVATPHDGPGCPLGSASPLASSLNDGAEALEEHRLSRCLLGSHHKKLARYTQRFVAVDMCLICCERCWFTGSSLPASSSTAGPAQSRSRPVFFSAGRKTGRRAPMRGEAGDEPSESRLRLCILNTGCKWQTRKGGGAPWRGLGR